MPFTYKSARGMATSAKTIPVVIAGAGPAGLSLALGLARQGVRSIIFEQNAQLSPHSRAVIILLRTLEAIQSWNAAERFLAVGEVLHRITAYASETNDPVFSLDVSPLAAETPNASIVVLPQDETEKLLYDAVMETGMCELRFNQRVTAAIENGDAVTVSVQPVSGDAYSLNAQFAVGADGAHSMVRQSIGLHLEGKTYPVHVFLADIRVNDERDTLPWPRISMGSPQALFTIRFANGQWRIVGTLTEAEAGASIDEAFLQPRIKTLFGGRSGQFDLIWQSIFAIHRRHAATFRKGRVILAGDAAHINSPAGGQGMNAGIQDAHNLAWKLAYALRGADRDVLLTSYDAERRFTIEHGVERLTDGLTRNGLTSAPKVRNALITLMNRLAKVRPMARRMMRTMMMINTRYRRSTIIGGKSSLVGVRSPIPETLVRYAPTLVVQRVLSEVEEAAAATQIADLTVVECPDWRPWKCSDPFAALVRPDGVVGYFERNPNAASVIGGVRTALGFVAQDRRETAEANWQNVPNLASGV
ncbi:MAG: hypothetical protein DLM53_00160 [Candidatus Eremiobacter antarcticus]|nr:MAG: hypothetical protein DLM53_00160 [Candidatus Eremiobacter sp. RRmetagenome_bin22]